MTLKKDSPAVMPARDADYSKDLDYYPTPPFATKSLCDVIARSHVTYEQSVREPAAGGGHMAQVLNDYFGSVECADVHDYGMGYKVENYLAAPRRPVDWVITNPPFKVAERFVQKALHEAEKGVAMLCRLQFLETRGRWARLFCIEPPTHVLVFSDRLRMVAGRLPTKHDERSALTFAWFVWDKVWGVGVSPRLEWLPPEDYHNPRLL